MKSATSLPFSASPFVRTALVLALSSSLAACAGGGGGSGARPPEAPAPDTPAPAPVPPPVTDPVRPDPNGPEPNPGYRAHERAYRDTIDAAIKSGYTGKGVAVGVADSGVLPDDIHLKGKVKSFKRMHRWDASETELPGGGFAPTQPDPSGHGTAVSKVLAGERHEYFYGGTAMDVGLHVRQVGQSEDSDKAQVSSLALAWNDLMDNTDVRIINTSMNSESGTSFPHSTLNPTLDKALDKGVLFVTPTGNDAKSEPGGLSMAPLMQRKYQPIWLAVAAHHTDANGNTQLESFSNACGMAKDWCMTAPGRYVNSATTARTGTSFAAPVVAGAAALLQEKFPWYDGKAMSVTLLTTATDLGAPGVDSVYGWGALNIEKALKGPAALPHGILTVNVTPGHYKWENDIKGLIGGINKHGQGTLELTGQNEYVWDTRVEEGTLKVSGSLASKVIVASGATATGEGRVAHLHNNGRVASFGAGMAVDGDYVQASDAVLETMIGSVTKVGGNAALNGGELKIAGLRAGYTPSFGVSTTVLEAGSITGTFGSLTAGSGLTMDATLDYTPTSAGVTLTRFDMSSVAQAAGADQVAAAELEKVFRSLDEKALDPAVSTANGHGEDSILSGAAAIQAAPDAGALKETFYSLGAGIYSNGLNVASLESMEIAHLFGKDLAHAPKEGIEGFAHYRDTRGRWGVQGARGEDKTQSQWLGAKTRITDNLNVGAAFVNMDTRWNEALSGSDLGASSRVRQQGLLLGANLNTDTGGYVQTSAGYLRVKNSVSRTVALGADRYAVGEKVDGHLWLASLSGGQTFDLWKKGDLFASVHPSVGLDYSRLTQKAFSESGAQGFAFAGQRTTQDNWTVRANLETRLGLLAAKHPVQVGFNLGLAHDLNDRDMRIEGAYVGAPDVSIRSRGSELPRTRYESGISVASHASKDLTLQAGYTHRWASGWRDNSWNLNLQYRF